eukprot:m.100563 g.100563  ORF g.100563 m.100563 type:complete len:516 (-) comp27255_c1_seq1:38-1585(-)
MMEAVVRCARQQPRSLGLSLSHGPLANQARCSRHAVNKRSLHAHIPSRYVAACDHQVWFRSNSSAHCVSLQGQRAVGHNCQPLYLRNLERTVRFFRTTSELNTKKDKGFMFSKKGPQLLPGVIDALKANAITSPSPVQKLAIPAILSGKDLFVAAETGSGKTFAYLAPLISLLRQQEIEAQYQTIPNRPRVIVLAPTLELVSQIAGVGKALAHTAKIKVVALEGGHNQCAKRLAVGADVVVTTPARLKMMRKKKALFVSHLQHVVLDEADTLLDGSFWTEDLRPFLSTVRSEFTPAGIHNEKAMILAKQPQLIAVAATVKTQSYQKLKSNIKDLKLIEAAGTHAPPPQITQKFVGCPGHNGKIVQLISSVRSHTWTKLLIFCNKAQTCSMVTQTLHSFDIPATTIHGDLHPKIRRENYAKFCKSGGVLVLTDVGSRGLDFPEVNLVMLYDMPSSSPDYLHRIGRTGRAGKTGTAITLVSGKEDKRLAHELQKALKSQRGLPCLLSKSTQAAIDHA